MLGGREGITGKSLNKINEENPKLWRAHKKYLVNPHHIKGKVGGFKDCELVLSEGIRVPVSRSNYGWIKIAIRELGLDCPPTK